MISEPSRRISACSSPTALLAASSERNELEHTSSARPSVRWASVIRPGRISCSTTRIPDLATCQAASEPASPAPMICTISEVDLVPVIGETGSAFSAQVECASAVCWRQMRQRPRQGGRYPFVCSLKKISRCRCRLQPAECPNDQCRYRQFPDPSPRPVPRHSPYNHAPPVPC